METESENITPPSSPIFGYSGPKDHQSLAGSGLVFCLNCKGQPKPKLLGCTSSSDHSFSPNGYILRRELISALGVLTTTDTFGMDQRPSLYSLFGRKWDPTDFMQLKKLLSVCRKNITSLEILADPVYSFNFNGCGRHRNYSSYNQGLLQSQDDYDDDGPWLLRKNVCLFLNFIVSRRNYFAKTLTNSQTEDLFGGLRKSLGKAENWSSSLKSHCGYRNGNECSSALYHTFHLQLEVRWSILIVYGADPSCVRWILEDLIFLAWYKYNMDGNINLCDKQPFNCWCVKELWTMFRLLLEELEKNFWETYAQGMITFMSNNKPKPDIFFPIWLTVHIASLCNYNLSGMYDPTPRRERAEGGNNGYPFVNEILKEWASRGGKSVEIMNLVHMMVQYWGFDLDVVVLFWNHFLPKLDKNLEGNSVGSTSNCLNQYESVDKWVELIQGLITEDNKYLTDADENAVSDYFLTFLRLMVGHARLCNQKDWKKLKSHLGMKLNRNNVGHYGEIGLVRVSTLYLALGFFTADTVSMSERLKEILGFVKSTPVRKKIVLRAQATMILLMLKKSQDIGIIDITHGFMDTTNAVMSQAPLDSMKKDMIMVYLELLDSLPSPSTPDFDEQSLGRELLISPNLTMWLSNCGLNYFTRSLRVLNKLTSWIMASKTSSILSYSNERDEMAVKISERTFQLLTQSVILKDNRMPTTDVEPLAILAADLTALCKGTDTYVRHFDHFVLNERTCPEVSQYYVKRLLSSPVSLQNNISDLKWCQVWIRLIALNCNLPDDLNEKVIGSEFQSTSNEALLQRFCSTSEEWTKEDTQTILHPLVVLCKAAVGTVFVDNPNGISSITNACAVVLKYIKFEKVYLKGDSMSAAHQILEKLVPTLVGTPPWEKLPKQVIVSLKNHLFDMFETIVSYPNSAYDPYLKRKVQDIVTFAVLGFVGTKEHMNDDHPAIKIMTYVASSPIESVEAVLNQSINNLCSISKDAKLTPRFVLAVNGLRLKKLVSAVMKFLPGILTIYVSSPSPEISTYCVLIAVYCCTFGLTPFKTCLLKSFEQVMEANFAFKSRRFYELCTLLNKCQRHQVRIFLRTDLVPLLVHHVDVCEMRRGIGTDNSLRKPLESLKQEISALDAQSQRPQ